MNNPDNKLADHNEGLKRAAGKKMLAFALLLAVPAALTGCGDSISQDDCADDQAYNQDSGICYDVGNDGDDGVYDDDNDTHVYASGAKKKSTYKSSSSSSYKYKGFGKSKSSSGG